jgi:hypothetical protein
MGFLYGTHTLHKEGGMRSDVTPDSDDPRWLLLCFVEEYMSLKFPWGLWIHLISCNVQ